MWARLSVDVGVSRRRYVTLSFMICQKTTSAKGETKKSTNRQRSGDQAHGQNNVRQRDEVVNESEVETRKTNTISRLGIDRELDHERIRREDIVFKYSLM